MRQWKHHLVALATAQWPLRWRLGSLAVTLLAAGGVELLAEAGYRLYSPGAVLLTATAFVALVGGLWAGLASVAAMTLYYAYFLAAPDRLGPLTPQDVGRVFELMGLGVVLVWMLDAQRRRLAREVHERAARAALQSSRARWEAVFNNVNDPIFLTCADAPLDRQRIVEANAAAIRLTGFSHDELCAMRVGDIVPADVPLDRYGQALAAEGSVLVDSALRCKDGRVVATEVNSHRVELDGEPVLVSVCRDVSERHRQEQMHAWLAAIVDASQDAIVGLDLDGRIQSWNPGAERIFGYSAREAIGQGIGVLYPPEGGCEPEAILARFRQGQRIEHIEKRLTRRDGQLIDVSYSLSPIWDADGQLTGIAAVARDITARNRDEQALRDSEQRFRTIFDHAAVGIVLAEPDGRLRMANETFARILGYSRQELVGVDFRQITHPDDLSADEAQARLLVEGGIDWYSLEKRFVRPDGEWVWTNLSCAAVRDGQGRFVSAVGVVEDITARKQALEQLQGLKETLEQRVAERTAMAERRAAQLRTLAAQLTQAEQRERRRLAQILHDHLQQILAAGKMGLSTLLHRLSDPDQRRQARSIEELLEQAIEASRSLSVELSPPVLYDAGLPAALVWLSRQMRAKQGLEVQVQADDHAQPQSEEVGVLLFQAARELLFNVIKHAGVRQARVELTCADEQTVRLDVVDEGVGFGPVTLANGESSEGGFGLFSIRERLEWMGGRLHVQSAPGEGTRMTLLAPRTLPVRPTRPGRWAHGPPEPVPAGGPAGPSPGRQAGRIRVLLADDHALLREGLAGLLEEQGDIEVVAEAGDGETAVAIAHQTHPDVVVMDVSLPRLTGIEATRQLHQEMPEVRVIGLSMHEEADMAQAMRQAGATAYLTKGGPSDELIAAIRSGGDAAA